MFPRFQTLKYLLLAVLLFAYIFAAIVVLEIHLYTPL